LPIIKGIYLFTLKATVGPNAPVTSIGTELRFGVWGVCVNRWVACPLLRIRMCASNYCDPYGDILVPLMSLHCCTILVNASVHDWVTPYQQNTSMYVYALLPVIMLLNSVWSAT
jgi:hypothetical protein